MISSASFALFIKPIVSNNKVHGKAKSQMRFGGINEALMNDQDFSRDIIYFNLIQNDTWRLQISNVEIDS